MRIFVDADACPVKEIIKEIGEKYQLPVVMVCSIAHFSSSQEGAEYIFVDNMPEASDLVIANKIKQDDILITQDYGLAALVLNKGCLVLHHSGKRYTQENIDRLLFKRHLAQKIRRGGKRTTGPKAFTKEDKERFRKALEEVVLYFSRNKRRGGEFC